MTQVFLFESENLPKEKRLRFVLDAENKLWFDLNEKAPAYKAFYIPVGRSFFDAFIVSPYLDEISVDLSTFLEIQVIQSLKVHFLQSLSLAQKAGVVVVGMPKILEQNEKNALQAVILADDAGKDASKRVHSWKIVVCHGVTSLELEKALGQHNVSVVGVKRKSEAKHLLRAHQKLNTLMNTKRGDE